MKVSPLWKKLIKMCHMKCVCVVISDIYDNILLVSAAKQCMRSLVRDVRMIKFPFRMFFGRVLGGVISNGCERAAAPTALFASTNPEASFRQIESAK